ncbi:MAG: hypothetical protein H0V12_11895 [Chloroflexi bacterium]|nr:hypothetical protein [Chloroflexota bacterium]
MAPGHLEQRLERVEGGRRPIDQANFRQPTSGKQKDQQVPQGRKRDARLPMDLLPEQRRGGGHRTFAHDRYAGAEGGSLRGVQERSDALDVVADVGHQGDVGGRGSGHGPEGLMNFDVRYGVLGHALAQDRDHAVGRLDGDDLPNLEGERQGVPAAACPDVEPGVVRMGQLAKHLERRLVSATRIQPKAIGHGGVEVRGIIDFPVALDLLPIGSHPRGPRGQRLPHGRAQWITTGRHGRSVR